MPRDLPTLTALLDLAERGRYVFMLGRTKRPVANCAACANAGDDHDREACACLLCHGHYAGTRDPDRIRAMVDAVPGGMPAVRTGAPSGLVVVDIDPRHGGRITPDMPPTEAIRTGSGDGLHLDYLYPGVPVPCSAGRVGPGIDVRGDGGYHVVPPAIHPRTGRPYRWANLRIPVEMPPALLAACLPPTPAVATTTTPTLGRAEGITDPEALLSALLGRLDKAPAGRRRVTLYGVSRGVARMVAAGALTRRQAWDVLTEAGRDAGQSGRDARRAIEGGFRAEGVTV